MQSARLNVTSAVTFDECTAGTAQLLQVTSSHGEHGQISHVLALVARGQHGLVYEVHVLSLAKAVDCSSCRWK